MRGFPPLHLLFFVLAFAALAVPLTRLTFGRQVPAPVTSAAVDPVEADQGSHLTSGFLRLRFSHPPVKLEIKPLADATAEPLLAVTGGAGAGAAPSSPMESNVKLPINDHSVELSISAEWAADVTQAAITVDLEPDGMESRSQTVWADGNSLDEVLTFVWKS